MFLHILGHFLIGLDNIEWLIFLLEVLDMRRVIVRKILLCVGWIAF